MRSAIGARLHNPKIHSNAGTGASTELGPKAGWYGPFGEWDPRPAPDFNFRALSRAIVRQAMKDLQDPLIADEAREWIEGEDCADLCRLLRLDPKKVRECLGDKGLRDKLLSLFQRVEASERAAVV